MSDLIQKSNQAVNDTQSLAETARLPSSQTATQAVMPGTSLSPTETQAMMSQQGQALSEAVAGTVSVNNIQRMQLLQADLNSAQVNSAYERSPLLDPAPSHMFTRYYTNQMIPFITRDVHKRKFAQAEDDGLSEELNEERGDLFMAELKLHLAQLGMPTKGHSAQKSAAGKTSDMSRGNIAALLYEKLISMLSVFPWFYNFIKGVVLMRTTKQD